MSELKAFELFGNRNGEAIGIDKQNKTLNLDYKEVYLKSEADKVIAELKAKLEDVQASMYADVVDANMENRRLKRALWLARAWGANQRTKYLDFFLTGRAHAIRKYKWIKITSKCRAKAEKYK